MGVAEEEWGRKTSAQDATGSKVCRVKEDAVREHEFRDEVRVAANDPIWRWVAVAYVLRKAVLCVVV